MTILYDQCNIVQIIVTEDFPLGLYELRANHKILKFSYNDVRKEELFFKIDFGDVETVEVVRDNHDHQTMALKFIRSSPCITL